MTNRASRALGRKPALGVRTATSLVAGVALVACGGCQTLIPDTMKTPLGLGKDARIVRQAKADSFPSPADVGLTQPTSVP